MPGNVGDQRRTTNKMDGPQDSEKIMKMLQDMLVKCNSKPEDFQDFQDKLSPRVTVMNVELIKIKTICYKMSFRYK